MILVPLFLASLSAAATFPFEIASNKPWVPVSLDGSAPQWFILDTGNRGTTLIARECADRLKLEHGPEQALEIGAGAGAKVTLSTAVRPVFLRALGDTLTIGSAPFVTFEHISAVEGRRLDGSLGYDFLSRHVVEIDYAHRQVTMRDTTDFVPPSGATIVPVDLETGWAIAEGTISLKGRDPMPCRLIVDTGVRFTIALFQPFCEKYELHDVAGNLSDLVVGAGVGGLSRGDVGRLETLTLGPISFSRPVAVFSRDSKGIFAMDGPDGIIGGELLKHYRTTFDYPHGRLILEPYGESPTFEFDMSGLFLAADPPSFRNVRVLSVNPRTPAAQAGLKHGDEILSIDGKRTPELTLEQARALLRTPGTRQLQVLRSGQLQRVILKSRRLV